MSEQIMKKVIRTMQLQNPNEDFVKCCNVYRRKYENEKKYSTVCIMNNEECENQNKKVSKNTAINSHSIQEKKLKRLCKDSKVMVLKDDIKNPFKKVLHPNPTKNTTTFKGFCNYHDKNLFKSIEDNKDEVYDEKSIFLFAFRALAKFSVEEKMLIDFQKWRLDNWTIKEAVDIVVWKIIFEMDELLCSKKRSDLRQLLLIKYLRVKHIIKYAIYDKFSTKRLLKSLVRENDDIDVLIKDFKEAIMSNRIIQMEYRVYNNSNNIAFSDVINDYYKGSLIPFYIIIVPDNIGSKVIVACSKRDFSTIGENHYYQELMNGNQKVINQLIHTKKENLVFDPQQYENEIADAYFLENEISFLSHFDYVNIIR